MVLVVIALAIIFLVYLTVIKQTNSKYWSDTPSVSDNGNIIAFQSNDIYYYKNSINIKNARPIASDIFVYDILLNKYECVSIDVNGSPGNAESYNPIISPNGNYVYFESDSTNLGNRIYSLYIRDRINQKTLDINNIINIKLYSNPYFIGFNDKDDLLIVADDNIIKSKKLLIITIDGDIVGNRVIENNYNNITISQNGRYIGQLSQKWSDHTSHSQCYLYDSCIAPPEYGEQLSSLIYY